MKSIRGEDRDMRDDELTGALRAIYAAPVDDSYWSALERRIMDTVAAERAREWWSWFPGWVRIGLTAAAAAALIAALASWQARDLEQRMAFDRLIGTPSDIPLLTESDRFERRAEREATLRYLITHD
jgi:hypothetical protein